MVISLELVIDVAKEAQKPEVYAWNEEFENRAKFWKGASYFPSFINF